MTDLKYSRPLTLTCGGLVAWARRWHACIATVGIRSRVRRQRPPFGSTARAADFWLEAVLDPCIRLILGVVFCMSPRIAAGLASGLYSSLLSPESVLCSSEEVCSSMLVTRVLSSVSPLI